MNRILLSLMIIMIALTGIASVSASSDFNETVDLEECVLDVGDLEGDFYYEEYIAPNATENDSDSSELDDVTEDDSDSVVIDNVNEPAENDTEIEVNNKPNVNKSVSPVGVVKNEKKLPLRLWKVVDIPDVDVRAPRISTGDRITDAAVHYTAYYKAYKAAFSSSALDVKNSFFKPIEALIAFVYQSYNESDTIDIVTKAIHIAEGDNMVCSESETHSTIYKYFYEEMYYDEMYLYYHPPNSGVYPNPHYNPFEEHPSNPRPWEKNDPKA